MGKPRKATGKEVGAAAVMMVQDVPLAEIVAGDNDRKAFDPVALESLAASIAAQGRKEGRVASLAQPITVRPRAGGGYEIVAGERRYRAHVLLGAPTIQAMVRPMDDATASEIMLAENTGRSDLSPVEEGKAYARRIAEGRTVAETAEIAGVSVGVVNSRMGLLKLAPEIQKLAAERQIPLAYAELMAGLDFDRQRIALRILASGKGEGRSLLSWDAFRGVVGQLETEQGQEALFGIEALWIQAQAEPVAGEGGGPAAPWWAAAVPVLPGLPPVKCNRSMTYGAVLENYIMDLRADRRFYEAAVVSHVLHGLMLKKMATIHKGGPLDRVRLDAEAQAAAAQ